MKILFLYSEIMSYNIAEFIALVKIYGAEIHVVRWDHKKLTPYSPPPLEKVFFYKRSELSEYQLLELTKQVTPSICYISGWMDKGYLKCGKLLKNNGVPVMAGMDNQWTGSLRQRIGCLLSPYKIKPYFSHILAAGLYQYEFARRLGFHPNNIIMHMVTANVDLFQKAYQEKKSWGKRILFVGRFTEVKGIELLYNAFKELENEYNGWELILIGDGELKKQFNSSKGIKIKNFMSSEELMEEAKNASIFCLPSRKEPWGVVIHEFAAAGLALLTSNVCGANTEFLKHGYNGYIFESNSKESLKKYLKILMDTPSEELAILGKRSNLLSQHLSPESWAADFVSVLK